MWTLLAFLSALCLGFYDISKKIALRDNKVIDVLTLSICFSSLVLSVPLLLSRLYPEWMTGTAFYVPRMDLQAHLFTVLKSLIVLSSWVFAYVSLKHLPLSVVSPMQATRPMWTLIGALLIFGERLNTWQWLGVCLAIGTVLVFSLSNASGFSGKSRFSRNSGPSTPSNPLTTNPLTPYYLALALAILIGACSGLYDKYLMRRYDHNAVQVYYTFYQALMMLIVWLIDFKQSRTSSSFSMSGLSGISSPSNMSGPSVPSGSSALSGISVLSALSGIKNIVPILLISLFLIISDNVYMLALRDPDSLIAVVSTIRRGGAVIGFAYGLIFLKEKDPLRKLLCMLGILSGLLCLAIGSL